MDWFRESVVLVGFCFCIVIMGVLEEVLVFEMVIVGILVFRFFSFMMFCFFSWLEFIIVIVMGIFWVFFLWCFVVIVIFLMGFWCLVCLGFLVLICVVKLVVMIVVIVVVRKFIVGWGEDVVVEGNFFLIFFNLYILNFYIFL